MTSRWPTTWSPEVFLGENVKTRRQSSDVTAFCRSLCRGSDRRVHISEETMRHLDGAYQVENTDGGSRDALLKDRKTFLVIDPHEPDRSLRRPQEVRSIRIKLFRTHTYHFIDVNSMERIIYFFLFNLTKFKPYKRKNNSHGTF